MFPGEWHSQVYGLKRIALAALQREEWRMARVHRGHHEAIKEFRQAMARQAEEQQRSGREGLFWSLSPQDLVVGWMCGQGKGGPWSDSWISSFSHNMTVMIKITN